MREAFLAQDALAAVVGMLAEPLPPPLTIPPQVFASALQPTGPRALAPSEPFALAAMVPLILSAHAQDSKIGVRVEQVEGASWVTEIESSPGLGKKS